MKDNDWAAARNRTKPAMPPLEDVAAMIREGEFVEDIATTFDRADRTLRDSLRRAGWDPDTGFELTASSSPVDLEEIVASFADQSWTEDAFCAQIGGEPFYPEFGEQPTLGKSLCGNCSVRAECLTYALEANEQHGVWGGLTGRERAALLLQEVSRAEVA